jgi:hypothetical protein
MDRETLFAALFNPDALVPGDSVTNARLRIGRRDDNRIAKVPECHYQRRQTSSINSVIVCDQKFHFATSLVANCELTLDTAIPLSNLYHMKTRNLVGLFIVLCAIRAMAESLPDYIAVEAWRHIGEKANVTGRVEHVHQSHEGSIFLDLGGKHPDNPFTAFIPQSAAEKFLNFKDLDGVTITVSGTIKEYNKKAEIVVTEPSQITRKQSSKD